jgi:hypothetical protein
LTPPHVGAPEGHLTAIDKEEHAVEVAQEEAVEVTGGLGGGGAAERVTTDEKLKAEQLSMAVVDDMSSENRGGWEREPRR